MNLMFVNPPLEAAADGVVPSGPAQQVLPPMIYTRVAAVARLSWSARITALAVALGCLGVLIVAAGLEPNPAGMGTHTQLGLRSCAFLAQTGIPCPTCGMTTSFAYFVRGKLAASFYTQPMGCLLALGASAAVWVGFYIACTGIAVYRLTRLIPTGRCLMALLLFGILAWAWKIALVRLGS